MKKCQVVALFVATSSLLMSAQLHATNIADSDLVKFEAGKKAVAADVNANFEKVKGAVNSKQNRVTGACNPGSAIKSVNEDGSVACESVSVVGAGGGDITGVAAGVGLTGGGTSGDVGLAVNTSVIQGRVTGSCPAGSSINAIAVDGSVTCETDDVGAGGVTAITPGAGITASGTTGNVTLSVDTNTVQKKLSSDASCTAGSIVSSINPNTGVVSCVSAASGDITSVNTSAGSGLSGGVASGDVNLSIATGGVTSSHIADGAIVNADINAAAQINVTKIQGDVGLEYDQNADPGNAGFVSIPVGDITMKTLTSIVVSAPQAGTILAFLSGDVTFFGDGTTVQIGIGATSSAFVTSATVGNLDGNVAARYHVPYSTMAVIPVSAAGNVTVYGLAQGNTTFNLFPKTVARSVLAAVFIPKRY